MTKPQAFALKSLVAMAAALGLSISAAQAEDSLKVGLIATLSGPPAVLGQQLRNGFTLAVKTLGGKLGGREAEVVVADDELKPDVAVGKVKALIDRDKVDFVSDPYSRTSCRRSRSPSPRRTSSSSVPTPERRASPAKIATRTSSSPPTRTTRCTKFWASMPRIPGSRR